jgi:hypothetical protein
MKSDKKESRPGALIGSDTNELPNAQSQIRLPERTQEFMQSGAAEGSRNEETFFAAQQLRDARISEQAAVMQLVPTAIQSGISEVEAMRAIRSAYSQPARAPIGRGTRYNSRPQVRRTPKFKKIETEPKELPDFMPNGDRALIEAAFNPGEFICISDTFEAEDGRHLPHDGNTYTREELLEWLKEKPINKIWTDQYGLFIRINPMLDGGNSDDHVTAFRHVLVECDEGTHEAQLGRIRAIGLPITAIIYSGKRSVHAWLRVDAQSIEEYRERVDYIFSYCEQALGMEMDKKNRNPSRYSRMADVQRALEIKEDEKGIPRVLKRGQQRLLEVNVPGKPWDEWAKDVDPTAPKPLPRFESWDDLEEAELAELKMILDGNLEPGCEDDHRRRLQSRKNLAAHASGFQYRKRPGLDRNQDSQRPRSLRELRDSEAIFQETRPEHQKGYGNTGKRQGAEPDDLDVARQLHDCRGLQGGNPRADRR